MKLPVKGLEKIIPKEDPRYAMNGMLFDREKQIIAITNGHYLTVLKVTECEDDDSGIVPREVVEAASKNDLVITIREFRGGENGELIKQCKAGAVTMPAIEAQFPNYEKFLGKEHTHCIAFSYSELKLLASVFATTKDPSIHIEFTVDEDNTTHEAATILMGASDLEMEIVLMPMTTDWKKPEEKAVA